MGHHERLSDHLATWEVFGDHEPSTTQWRLARHLARHVFEPVRAVLGDRPLIVTHGLRTQAKQTELQREGYKPSPSSDHSWMLDWNPWGVGAIDVMPLDRRGQPRAVTEREHSRVAERLLGVGSPFLDHLGQLIWYPVRGHLHLANPKALVFSRYARRHFPEAKPRRQFFIYPEGRWAAA